MPVFNGKWYPVLSYPINTTTTDINVFGRATLVMGYAFLETTGAAIAEVDLIDGNSVGGTLMAPVALSAGQSTRDTFSPYGLFAEMGPYLHVVTGSVRGALWYIDVSAADLAARPASDT